MIRDIKSPTTHAAQVEILKSRGCIIQDEEFCKKKLASINYYRLTAYFLPFKKKDGTYLEGTSFERIYRIYEFDRKLRGILFTAIEDVEIHLRSTLAYHHSHSYGPVGYLDASNFSKYHDHRRFTDNLNREIESNRQVLFVKHHIDNYDGKFPAWVAVELFTFGMLSYFYNDLKTPDRKAVAKKLYGATPKYLGSWLRCCTDLRNICAHYGRLYYRIFPAVPAGLNLPKNAERRLWGAVMALKSLYPDSEKWHNEVVAALEALVDEYQEDINLYHLAFPADWKEQLRVGIM